MKMLTRQLAAVLLVFAMVFAMATIGNAADQVALLKLSTAPNDAMPGDEVTVTVSAAVADVVADGKLTITYNSQTLEFLGVEAGAAWPENSNLSLQANSGKPGEVKVAFAGVYAAGAGAVLDLKFAAIDEGSFDVAIEEEDSYITDAGDYLLGAELDASVACPSAKFVDLNPKEYYHEGIDYVLCEGYMMGMGDNRFSPNTSLTRAQLVVILYRLAGEPEVKGTSSFKDIPEGKWYTDAVVWANQNEIAKGITKECFAPMQPVNREQMVTFFARYAHFCGISTESDGDLLDFVDADKVSGYAVDAMTWAVDVGLINGMTTTTLAPRGNSTRAQAAVVVYRFCTLVLGEKGR